MLRGIGPALTRYGVLVTFGILFVVFSWLRPSTFPTWGNMQVILNTAAVPVIVSIGAAIPLVMNDFDLSFASMMGLSGGAAVTLMAQHGVSPSIAIALVLALAIVVGVANGVAVAYWGASSFIITLAMASVLTGIEFAITGQKTLYSGIPASFVDLGQKQVKGLTIPVFVALALLVGVSIYQRMTVPGRWMYAIGGSIETASLAGVPVSRMRTTGFVACAVCGAVGGILLTASSAASYPQAGQPYLLPAFAAAFLGVTLFRQAQFSAMGAGVAAILLQMVAIGLIQLNQPQWAINVMHGTVLLVAVLFSRWGRRTA